jgi:hypothetical protein
VIDKGYKTGDKPGLMDCKCLGLSSKIDLKIKIISK